MSILLKANNIIKLLYLIQYLKVLIFLFLLSFFLSNLFLNYKDRIETDRETDKEELLAEKTWKRRLSSNVWVSKSVSLFRFMSEGSIQYKRCLNKLTLLKYLLLSTCLDKKHISIIKSRYEEVWQLKTERSWARVPFTCKFGLVTNLLMFYFYR